MKFEVPNELTFERDPLIFLLIGNNVPYQSKMSDYIDNPAIVTGGYDNGIQFDKVVSDISRRSINDTIYAAFNKRSGSRRQTTSANIAHIKNTVTSTLNKQNQAVQMLIQQELEKQKQIEKRRKEEEEKIRKEILSKQEAERKEQLRQAEELKKIEEAKLAKQLAEKKEAERLALEKKAKEEKQKQLDKQDAEKSAAEKTRKAEEIAALEATALKSASSLFITYTKDIADIKINVVAKLNADINLKKQVGVLRRKINPKFGQLSNLTAQFNKVNSEVILHITSAKPFDLAYQWILNFVAKAIVDQAETEVPVQQNSAMPLAKLAYSLLKTFPEFEYYFMARLVKKCPFIIGFSRSIDTEEGRTQMGWKKKDGKWEDDVKYDERVSGVASLWSVMCRLKDYQPQLDNFSFEASWRFLARIANTPAELLTNTHYSIVAAWWDVTAKHFLASYGTQSQKLMYTLVVPWVQLVQQKRFAAAARLSILGEDWLVNRKIESIKEMER